MGDNWDDQEIISQFATFIKQTMAVILMDSVKVLYSVISHV
mgnify:CR=1 FL=1